MKDEIIEIYDGNRNYYKKHLTSNHINFLNKTFYWTDNIKEQIYCLRFGIYTQPECGYDKCDKHANFKGMTEGYGVGGCCRKHGQIISNLKKYGYEMPFKDTNVLEKAKRTCIEHYGVDNPMKNKEIAKKTSQTRKNYSETQKCQYLDKRSKTWKEKYGVDNIFEKVDYIEECMMEKYGVRNPAQSTELRAKNDIPKSRLREYVWQSGEISMVQGFEDIVLSELEQKGYSFYDVKTKKSDMPEIWYVGVDGKKHRYYPDFYIPRENIIIEVKSNYTMESDYETNQIKAQSVRALGYNFKFEIRNKR